jgi:hypothetical protein
LVFYAFFTGGGPDSDMYNDISDAVCRMSRAGVGSGTERITTMKLYSKVTLGLLLASMPWQLRAMPEAAQAPRDGSGETLTAKAVQQLEKTAVNAEDHQRLAAYYQVQAEQAEKKLANAQELEKQWGPMERASKTPDPYPHARRLVAEYSAEVQKYSRLSADHQWVAEKYEVAARALKDGGNASDVSAINNSVSQNSNGSGGQRNAFVLGPKVKPSN